MGRQGGSGRRVRRGVVGLLAAVLAVAVGAAPAWACAGLVGRGGTVRLGRTTTLAAYHDGVEHYVTSFTYQGGGAQFGSIVPLPGVPTDVRKGGEWTLQRLELETNPRPLEALAGDARAAAAPAAAVELFKTRVDALDLTVLKGGGAAVGTWARQHGFQLTVDAPEVLDFYAARSPIFLAAVYDPRAAGARGQQLGDGTPIQLTIPTGNPWVPLRILGLGHQAAEPIRADVYLLTDRAPALLPTPAASSAGQPGLSLARSGWASDRLLADLHADRGMGWMPQHDMWLTYLRVDATAGQLRYDLASDVSGRASPSLQAAGLRQAPGRPLVVPVVPRPASGRSSGLLLAVGAATLVTVGGLALIALGARRER